MKNLINAEAFIRENTVYTVEECKRPLHRVVGVVVVYRTGIIAVAGSKHENTS